MKRGKVEMVADGHKAVNSRLPFYCNKQGEARMTNNVEKLVGRMVAELKRIDKDRKDLAASLVVWLADGGKAPEKDNTPSAGQPTTIQNSMKRIAKRVATDLKDGVKIKDVAARLAAAFVAYETKAAEMDEAA